LAVAALLSACIPAHRTAPSVAPVTRENIAADADSTSRVKDRALRFYKRLSFGSESEFDPLTEVLNEGFGILQTQGQDRHVFRRDYAAGARNVMESVVHPVRTYADYGWRRAVRNEWLPLTPDDGKGGGAWVPNYLYHFFGGGMVGIRMSEWYAVHGVSHPELASATTFMGMQFLNEVVENAARRGSNEDATTDLLIFDPAALLVWRWGAMQRLFSGPLELTNWPAQPSIDVPSGTLENVGQEYVLRAPIPKLGAWHVFAYFNMTSLVGLSHPLPNGASLSVGGGVDAIDNPVVDPRTGAKGATLRPKAGIFYDREGSLLWSLQVGSRRDIAVVNANIYPGLVHVGGYSPGLFVQVPRHAGVRVGLVSPIGIGIGHGPER
jgi:hypothetical protein